MIHSKPILIFAFLFHFVIACISQKIIRYDLYIGDTTVNYSGKTTKALSINGQIPAPTLIFTEGDTAEILVHNTLKEETSIHWHGLILPNQYDGVPYLTTAPIKAGDTHLFRFALVQNGTYWYHSHTKLQEQNGLYGALIIHKKMEDSLKSFTIVLSDWTNRKPYEVHRSLHNANDWFAIQKHSTQNYFQALKEGQLKTKLTNEWKRMLAMDVSDVYYDALLCNGKKEDYFPNPSLGSDTPTFNGGEQVRLRIINGSSSTYFWLKYAGGQIAVVANDGQDVEPVLVDRMMIAVAETYDVIVTIPDNGSYEFLATSEDRTKSTSLWLGQGVKYLSQPMPKLKYFEGMKMMNSMMTLGGNMKSMGMEMSNQIMDMNTVMYPEITGELKSKNKKDHKTSTKKLETNHGDASANLNVLEKNNIPEKSIITLNYTMLKSLKSTQLTDAKLTTYRFELTGNMNRYVWSINNKTVSESDKILIKKGENIRLILYNNSMMRHPMHLHGHFFRLLNGQGDYSPLKNTLDIMPMETDTIEFAGTESGDWFFHCHILYHMMSGMGRIFSYENSPNNPELPNAKKAQRKLFASDRQFHPMLNVDVASNGVDGEFMYSNTRWNFQTEWRLGYNNHHGYEVESHFGRYFGKNQFWFPYIGFDFRYRHLFVGEIEKNLFQQMNTKDRRTAFCVGFQYTLPMLVKVDFRIDSDLKFRVQLMREDIPLSSRLRMSFMLNTDLEYMVGMRYILTRNFSVSAHYDSDMMFGGGITFSY